MSAAALPAQNTLPDPHDGACWQSLSTLRACELHQYDRAVDQAERCTSYPECQCRPSAEQSDSGVPIAREKSKTSSGKSTAWEHADRACRARSEHNGRESGVAGLSYGTLYGTPENVNLGKLLKRLVSAEGIEPSTY